jgi:FtsZ-binding cell division protein ZapB
MSYRPPHTRFAEKGLDRTVQHAYDLLNKLQREIDALKKELAALKKEAKD